MLKLYYVIEDLNKSECSEDRYFVISEYDVINIIRVNRNHYKFIEHFRTKKEAMEFANMLRRKAYMSNERIMSLYKSYYNYINEYLGGN